MKTITDRQIAELLDAAGSHGDLAMVAICRRALNGSARARRECIKAIAAGEANDDAMLDDGAE